MPKLSDEAKERIIIAIARKTTGEEIIAAIEYETEGSGASTTDGLPEGSVNKYFTEERAADAAPVQSVNNMIGNVELDKTDIGLSNVDDTSDANKPISTATQNALNDKADSDHVHDLSVLTQSGATNGQVPVWNGTAWAPAAVPAGAVAWGDITGDLIDQTDLQSALDAKFDDPAGTVSQYIRGDGSLANFPSTGGGGSSVSYYLNGGTASDIATYYQMSKLAVVGTNADFTASTGSTVLIAQFMTDAGDPSLLNIPAGNWNLELYFNASSSGGSPRFYVELYKYDGVSSTLIASNSATPENITGGTSIDLYFTALAIPSTTLASTDRLEIRVYVTRSGRNITLHTQDSHLCQIITNFSSGLLSLNGLVSQNQFFATGTTGTDFNISSSGSTHTFNIPVSSATNTGLLSSTNWTTFNNKLSKGVKTIFCIDNGDYATGQAAVDAASQGDTILFGAKAGGWGDLVIPAGKKLSLMGLQSAKSIYVQIGSITFSPTTGTQILENELYLDRLYIYSTTSTCLTHGGTAPSRIRANNCFINAGGAANRAVHLTNTNAASSSYLNECTILSSSSATIVQTSVTYVRMYRSTIDGTALGLQVDAGTVEQNTTNITVAVAGSAINVTGGSLLSGYSLIANTAANSSGVAVSAGAVFANTYNVFSVPAGTGYCVRGAGIHVYGYMTFSNSVLAAYNVKVQNTLTNVPYTTAFTLSP